MSHSEVIIDDEIIIENNKKNFEKLKEQIEMLNNQFLKDKQIIDVLNKNQVDSLKGS